MLFLQNRLKVCPRGLLYSGLGLDIDLKLSIYNWRPEGFIDFKVLNIGDTSEWSVHWIQPCGSTEKGLWKTTHCLYWWSDCTVKYCTYWQAGPFGHCTLCHLSTVHSVPIISLGGRLYYLAVHSYIAHLFQHSNLDSTRSTIMRTLSQFPMQSPGWWVFHILFIVPPQDSPFYFMILES